MARKPILQRIALDGVEKIRKQLKQLGVTGEKTFKDLKKASDALTGPGAKFFRSLEKAQRKLKAVGTQFRKTGATIRSAGRTMFTALLGRRPRKGWCPVSSY